MTRRAIYVNCDGLERDWIARAELATLSELRRTSLWCSDHRAIFPSATRASAASMATGCLPRRHGLFGNRVAFTEDGRLVVYDVGHPDFFDDMRRMTGKTLYVPTLAERIAPDRTFVAYSNVSAGAAAALDPDQHGTVYHRMRSQGPGGAVHQPLSVTLDVAGDTQLTDMFLDDVLQAGGPTIGVLWFGNPDAALHEHPIGSAAHVSTLTAIDALVAKVVQRISHLREVHGEDILLIVGSDHGHEHISDGVDVVGWARTSGFGDDLDAGRIAFATQGTAFLVYASGLDAVRLDQLLDAIASQPWAGEVARGSALDILGVSQSQDLVAAVNMGSIARDDDLQAGRWAAFEGPTFSGIGHGQHGGWGTYETKPFLIVNHPNQRAMVRTAASSLVDIAPTILQFIGLPTRGMDGSSLGGM
ncbi:MAG: alkaline phosphatase family protein [Pseudomonadota bacterium]